MTHTPAQHAYTEWLLTWAT